MAIGDLCGNRGERRDDRLATNLVNAGQQDDDAGTRLLIAPPRGSRP